MVSKINALKNIKLHRSFSLNDKFFLNKDDLLEYTKLNLSEVHTFLKEWFDAKEYIKVNSSGSTGNPKQIELKKEHMINSALATGKFFDLSDKTTALLCMPLKYIAGKMMLVRAMVLGWNLDIVEATSNPLKNTKRKYDFTAMIPLQLHNSLNEIHLIKKIIVGGGAVSDELIDKIKDISTEIYATYGMTETITHIAVKPLNRSAFFKCGYKNSYKTLPEISIAKDKRNCLIINAPKISDKAIITNDLVDIISSNNFNWIGRFDNIINSGGIKIIPEKLEKKLLNIISNRFFISSLPDEKFGEKIILIVEGKGININYKKIKEVLSKYEIPKETFFIDRFIDTSTKKIQRQKTLDLIKL